MVTAEKLGSLNECLDRIFRENRSVCLWFSGGSDSRLLLETLIAAKKTFGILRFDDGLRREQKRLIDETIIAHNLQVFSYPARLFYLIGDAENLSLVSDYAIDGAGRTVPILRDLVAGEKCAFDVTIEAARQARAPIEFDAHIWGTRFDDVHYSVENLLSAESWTVGEKKFYAPLADWARREVTAGLKNFGIDYQTPIESLDTGNLPCCFNCLKGEKAFCPKENREIEPHVWDKKGNTETFRRSLRGENL